MADVDDNVWRRVDPQGLALALVVTSAVFVVLTSIVISMRVFIRLKLHAFGADDWVMCSGYLVNLGQLIVTIYGAHSGLGTKDHLMNQVTINEGTKALLVWQAFYACSLALIKSSICVTLIRITQERVYLIILRILIGLSAGLSGVGLIVILNQCHPIERYWDKTIPGTCWPPIIATVLSYAASVSNVITDFSVACIPFFMLRHVNIKPKIKLYIRLILGMGILAGVASIVRVPFTNAYMQPTDVIYYSGNIVLWTVVECGLGIIAGSLPTLRSFFKRLVGDESTGKHSGGPSGGNNNSHDLVTIGQVRGRHNPVFETELQVVVEGGGCGGSDGENDRDSASGAGSHSGSGGNRLDGDSESTKRIITVTRRVDQVSSPVPPEVEVKSYKK